MKKGGQWRTKDGRVMLIKDMTDSHLLNSIAYLKRNVEKYRDHILFSTAMASAGMQGEMAIDSVEAVERFYQDATHQELLAEMGYYKLIAEKKRRNLEDKKQ